MQEKLAGEKWSEITKECEIEEGTPARDAMEREGGRVARVGSTNWEDQNNIHIYKYYMYTILYIY